MPIFLSIIGGFIAGCVLTYLYQSKVIAAGKKALADLKSEEQKVVDKFRRIG